MNIEGIKVFKGNGPGPKVGIMAITHGDEPCGLDAHLWIEEYLEKNSLEKGTLYLIKGNIEGYNKNLICIDDNLNRIFTKDIVSELSKKPDSYELNRALKLMPILKKLDYFLDIHSTNKESTPFSLLFNKDKQMEDIAMLMPVDFYSFGWGKFIKGTTTNFVVEYGGNAIAIECGSHLNPRAGEYAIQASKVFLHTLGLIKVTHPKWVKNNNYMEVISQEKVSDRKTFKYLKEYINFQPIGQNEVIAEDNNKKYIAPNKKNLHIIFPTKLESIKSGAIKEAYLIGKFSK